MTTSLSTNAGLLLRLRNPQDHAAWVEFVDLYEPAVYRMLRRHGLQDADARELMQDLFLAVSRSIDRWDPARERGSFRGWLRFACRNLVINWLRRGRARKESIGGDELQMLVDRPVVDHEPETREFDLEMRRTLFRRAAEQVRAEVRPTTWRAFEETCLAGTSTAEAASKLGLSPGAIRVARCRVLARLQAIVRQAEELP